MTSVCIDRPSPAPITAMKMLACHTGVSTPSVENSRTATNITAVPMIGSFL